MSSSSTRGSGPLLSQYQVDPATYDEMCSEPGLLRPHWSSTICRLEDLDTGELSRLYRESRRVLRENGVTYNVYGDPQGAWREWSFDPIPLMVSEEDWKVLETGLVERASLWNWILADLYGRRELVYSGLVPPELLDFDPNYLRAWRSPDRTGERALHLYAVDVARQPDGSFVVVEDRGQAPSGAGYALENRILLSRVLPDLYRETPVQRLAVFFRAMLTSLSCLAPGEEEPRVVLLTPGPGNETYFEHSYLANYLGLTLVEGSDLVVRDQKVWLRTLDGLERVHVIVRRLDDSFLDPLELRADSVLGVAGLLSAVRAGNVVLANPPGTGICENTGLLSMLPAIARHVLGRDLSLRTVRAWWCGRGEDLEYVVSHLDELVIKPISSRGSHSTIVPARLTETERSALVESIRAEPHLYAAREHVRLSQTPVLMDGGFAPSEMMLRTFLVSNGNTYSVMPGGLVRVAPVGASGVSNQEGGMGKDAWVLSSEPPRQVTLLPTRIRRMELRRGGGEIAIRVAENLFWLGRYAERSEGTARILRSIVQHLLEARTGGNETCPANLLHCVTHLTTTYPGFLSDDASRLTSPDSELLSLLTDRQRAGSLHYNLDALWHSTRSSRDRLSHDMWRILNSLDEGIGEIRHVGGAVEPLDQLILRLSALAGLVGDSMTRGPAYWFVDVGRRIERALGTINLLRSVFFLSDSLDLSMVETLLEVTDSLMTYRWRYKSRIHPAGVLDLLLSDETNPRSVAYQLLRLHEMLSHSPGVPKAATERPDAGLVLMSIGKLRATDVDSLESRFDDDDVRGILDGILWTIDLNLRQTAHRIAESYFSKVEAPHQLVELA